MIAISQAELDLLWSEYPYMPVVNVLSPEEFAEWHIPGTVNICMTEEDFPQQVETVCGGRRLPVVLYSGGEACPRPAQGAQLLEREGFTGVYVLEGGMEEWVRNGRAVERGYPVRETP